MSPTARSPRPSAPAARPAAASPATDHSDEALSERLRAAGLRSTALRRQLLQLLGTSQQPMSHAEIEAALGSGADRVTLYRALDSFVAAGLLLRQVGTDRVGRYAPTGAGNHAQHAHFHCDQCGKRYCIEEVHPPRRAALPQGFEVAGSTLEYHGLCASCGAGASSSTGG